MDVGIPYTPVGGEELSAVAYDEVTKTLYVKLRNGKTVIYYDVPVLDNVSLLAGESIEEYYNERIKDRFRYREL